MVLSGVLAVVVVTCNCPSFMAFRLRSGTCAVNGSFAESANSSALIYYPKFVGDCALLQVIGVPMRLNIHGSVVLIIGMS